MSNVIGISQERPRAARFGASAMLVAIGLAAGLAVGHVSLPASASARTAPVATSAQDGAAYQAYRIGERGAVAGPAAQDGAAYQAYRIGERADLRTEQAGDVARAYQAYRAGER